MSAFLLTATLAHLRAQFTRQEVESLQAYGGEFNSEEADVTSYNCPAVLVTVLGWAPEATSRRLGGRNVRSVRMAAFVAVKGATRELRLAGAMNLAEKLAVRLQQWVPDDTGLPVTLAPLEAEPTCENMYGRAMDKKGQALWLVSWDQCLKATVPLPVLYDLLAVDITDTTRQGTAPDAAPAAGGAVTVTETVNFAPRPSAA